MSRENAKKVTEGADQRLQKVVDDILNSGSEPMSAAVETKVEGDNGNSGGKPSRASMVMKRLSRSPVRDNEHFGHGVVRIGHLAHAVAASASQLIAQRT